MMWHVDAVLQQGLVADTVMEKQAAYRIEA
jgi:hypothetical protein